MKLGEIGWRAGDEKNGYSACACDDEAETLPEHWIADKVIKALICYHGQTSEDFDIDEYNLIVDAIRPTTDKLVARISMLQLENCKGSSVLDDYKDRIDELEMALAEGEKNSVSCADFKEVEFDRDTLNKEVIFHINAYKEEKAKCDELEREVQFHRGALGGLLAVMHRDGGHYTDAHGVKKSTEDAIAMYYAMQECVEWMRNCGGHKIMCRSYEFISGIQMSCTCGKDEALAKLDALKGGQDEPV